MQALRHRVARWLFQGRIRLGQGRDLEPIPPEELESIRRRFPRPKFFIFGHARSGTSFLARLIRLHPDVHCEWQTQFFSERGPVPYFTSPTFRHWLRHPSNRWTSGWDPTAALLRVCCDTLLERGAEQAGKGTVGDKSPNENGVEAVTWLSAVYPDARLIYIVRDGRDTVLSKRIQAFIDQPESLDRADRQVRQAFIQDPAPFLDRKRSIFTAKWLDSAAGRWAESVRESAAAGKRLFGDRFAVIRYEDLLANPYPVLRGLWSFLEVGAGPAELEAAIAGQIRQNPEADWHQTSPFAFVRALPRGTHGGWQSLFTQADADLFERRAGEALKSFGYLGP
ncbi:MAG TPA: sulfotransferase [Anaerolineales bacterium]|nr:sulfotransferase [Anaerolineales bacterium]